MQYKKNKKVMKIKLISKKIVFLLCKENKYSLFNFSKEKFSTLL